MKSGSERVPRPGRATWEILMIRGGAGSLTATGDGSRLETWARRPSVTTCFGTTREAEMTGTRRRIMAALAVLVLVGASASAAQGSSDDDETRTRLIGYQEVPSISTVGVGTFRARMVSDN